MSDLIYAEDNEDFMKNSLCYDCYYRLSKELKPIDGSVEEWGESLGIDIDENTVIEVHCCLLTQMDLDHIVFKCNKHLANNKVDFISNISKLKPGM